MPGGIPLDSKHAAAVNDQALEKAAAFLEKTAVGLEQMASTYAQSIDQRIGGFTLNGRHSAEYAAKAQLLRGQAGHIRAMKLNIQ